MCAQSIEKALCNSCKSILVPIEIGLATANSLHHECCNIPLDTLDRLPAPFILFCKECVFTEKALSLSCFERDTCICGKDVSIDFCWKIDSFGIRLCCECFTFTVNMMWNLNAQIDQVTFCPIDNEIKSYKTSIKKSSFKRTYCEMEEVKDTQKLNNRTTAKLASFTENTFNDSSSDTGEICFIEEIIFVNDDDNEESEIKIVFENVKKMKVL